MTGMNTLKQELAKSQKSHSIRTKLTIFMLVLVLLISAVMMAVLQTKHGNPISMDSQIAINHQKMHETNRSNFNDLFDEFNSDTVINRTSTENNEVSQMFDLGFSVLDKMEEGQDIESVFNYFMENLSEEMQNEINKLTAIAGNYIWTYEDNQLEEVVGNLLRKEKKTLALAESCTGGKIAHLITSVPGSSDYFKGSIVAYANEIKREILNVREQNIKKHGTVSEFVVSDMAINTMDLFDSDYCIATSGIAGPHGGTKEIPVGTVWIAVASNTRLTTRLFHFGTAGGRENIIQRATIAALNMLRLELVKNQDK
jgi:PncC family amidohydrolase